MANFLDDLDAANEWWTGLKNNEDGWDAIFQNNAGNYDNFPNKLDFFAQIKNLKKLDVNKDMQDITDLIPLSNLTNLSELHLVDCLKLKAYLDIKWLIEIKTLHCENCPELVKVLQQRDAEARAARNLINLKLSRDNQLQQLELNYANHFMLEYLEIFDFKEVTKIKLSGLVGLPKHNSPLLEIRIQNCPKLKNIDLSSSKKLQSLSVLNCTSLTTLDLRGCTSINLKTLNLPAPNPNFLIYCDKGSDLWEYLDKKGYKLI